MLSRLKEVAILANDMVGVAIAATGVPGVVAISRSILALSVHSWQHMRGTLVESGDSDARRMRGYEILARDAADIAASTLQLNPLIKMAIAESKLAVDVMKFEKGTLLK
jgi:hypothetical protein